jgi:cytochrome b
VGTGLISDDEIANMGPLSSLASGQWVSWATSWHKGWGKTTLILLVCIHLLALIWYRWRKRQALVPAMWHGDKSMSDQVVHSADHGRSRAWAFVLLLVSAIAVFGIVSIGG